MVRALIYLAMLGAVVAAAVWLIQRYRERAMLPRRKPPALQADELSMPATLAYGPESGHGLLRLTPSQLVFESSAGRVLVLERLAIVGVGTSHTMPDRTVARPVLVVVTSEQTWYFSVADPDLWEARLT